MSAIEALLVELDARPTITTTYGNAAALIRRALEADKDQP